MRNPLDLNNFPDDFGRDQGKQRLDDDSSSTSGINRNKKNGAKDDESGKVYECRFCSLKFCKSQALGGHMNRHRQERETEALNHARELVFSNDNILPSLPHQLGGQPMVHGGFYPTKLFSDTSTTILPPHMYTSPASRLNDYFVGHVCATVRPPPESANNYTCIGAPIGQTFTLSQVSGGGKDMSQSSAKRYHQDGI